MRKDREKPLLFTSEFTKKMFYAEKILPPSGIYFQE